MRRSFRALIGMIGVIIVGLVLGGAAASANALQLTTGTKTDCSWEWTRTLPVPHQEYKYEKTVPAVEGVKEFKYKKLIEGTPAGPNLWWVWAPNDTKGPQDYEPVFPEDDRGKWVGPKENGGPRQDTFGTFQTSDNGNSNWFHREHGTPGTEDSWEYSDWTTEVRGEPWVLVDERWKVEPQPEKTVLYKDGAWTTDVLGAPWVKIAERTVNGDEFIAEGPVRSSQEPDRGDYPDIPWTKVPGSEKCTDNPPPGDKEFTVTWGSQTCVPGAKNDTIGAPVITPKGAATVQPGAPWVGNPASYAFSVRPADGWKPAPGTELTHVYVDKGDNCGTVPPPPYDKCPNIKGNQPVGFDCSPTTVVVDKCSNIKGVQGPKDSCDTPSTPNLGKGAPGTGNGDLDDNPVNYGIGGSLAAIGLGLGWVLFDRRRKQAIAA
jgi:hypothetical protein